MLMFIIQAFLLIAIAYILGCLVGAILHSLFGEGEVRHHHEAGLATAGAAAATAGVAATATTTSKRSMHVEPAPQQPVTAVSSIDVKAEERRKAEEEAARLKAKAEEEARLKAEEEARLKAEADARLEAEAKAKAETEARLRAEEEARLEAEARAKAEAEARLKAEAKVEKPEPAIAKTAKVAEVKSDEVPKAAKKAKKKVVATEKDDLKLIRGIGPQNEARLNAIDITTFKQIARWGKRKQAEIGERLAFPGRIEREDWVGQAKILAKGKSTEFSKRVEKGEVESSRGEMTRVDLGKPPRAMPGPNKNGADDLTQITGIGKTIEKKLNSLGIFHYHQIAKWTVKNQEWIGYEIGQPGAVQREDWVKAAAKLSKK